MKIYALDSDNEKFQELINLLAQKVSIDLFDDFETLFNEIEVDCQGVLLDFDEKSRAKNKMITKLKKNYEDLNIFLLANDLDAKKLTKHQSSKTGAHLYFQTPLDKELLGMMLEPFFDLPAMNETDAINENSASDDTSEVSENIDETFSNTFVEEYTEPSDFNLDADDEVDESTNSQEIKLEQVMDEEDPVGESAPDEEVGGISMVDISLDGIEDESSDDLLGADQAEVSIDAEDDGDSFSLDEDESDDWSESSELSLTEDVENTDKKTAKNSMFPDDNDLSFPDIDPLLLEDDDTDDTDEIASDNELSLDEEDAGLKITDTAPSSQALNLEQDEEDSSEDDGIKLGSEQEIDAAGDMNTSVSLITGLDLNLEDDEEEAETNELTKPAMGLDSLKFTTTETPASEQQIVETQEDKSESEFVQDDEEDELTAGAFSVGLPENKFEAKNQDNIDDLLQQSSHETEDGIESSVLVDSEGVEEEAAQPAQDEISQNTSKDELTIAGVSIPNHLRHDNEEVAEAGEVTKTSIALDEGSLTSIDLPGELPDFSKSAQQKISEIEEMIGEEPAAAAIIENDGTLVASDVDQKTNIYQSQGITDDTIVMGNPHESPVEEVSTDLKEEHRTYVQSHDEELLRLGETIKNLREDRDRLNEKIISFETVKDDKEKDFLSMQAKLDEKSIELVVIKKRMEKQIDDLRFQLDIALDKKALLAKQNEQQKSEIERVSRQKQMDVNKVRSRERELEEKLELLRQDAEVQIKNREHKILELKRKIDTLEFDIENSHVNEKKSVSSQVDLQDKMDRVINTLRGAIGQLEDDYGQDDRKINLKKNLDI